MEHFNRQLRKVTKAKTICPTDDALFKSLYLVMIGATKKWAGKAWDWGKTLDQLCICFGDRIKSEGIYEKKVCNEKCTPRYRYIADDYIYRMLLTCYIVYTIT